MSNFTYTQSPLKKSRTYSQMSTSSNDHMFNLLRSRPSRLYVTPKREVGGAGVQKGGTAGKPKKAVSPSIAWINKTLFPITRFVLKNYGENFYDLTMPASTTATALRLTRAGTCKALRGLPTRQYWFEGYGLPLYWPFVGGTDRVQAMVPSCCSLLDLAAYAANNKVVSNLVPDYGSVDIGQPVTNGEPSSTNQRKLLDLRICYLGGYQKHTFVNVSNAHQFIEIYELHPRDLMFDWKVTGSGSATALRFKSVGEDLLKDYSYNDDTTNTDINPTSDTIDLTPTPTRYDDVNDMMVRIHSKCRNIHAKYKVSKPLKIGLAPGETFHYAMRFDPFVFEEGELLRYIESIANASDNSMAAHYTRPTSIPLFTKRLVVRAWGEVGHSSVTINTTGTDGTLSATQVTDNQKLPDYVANTQANLLHLQEERHAIRHIPRVLTPRDVIIDEKDQPASTVGASWGLEIMNEEIDGEETVDL